MAYLFISALALTLLAIFAAGVVLTSRRRTRVLGACVVGASLLISGLIVATVLSVSAAINGDIR